MKSVSLGRIRSDIKELERAVKNKKKKAIKKWLMEYSFMSEEDKELNFEKYKELKIKLAGM